jgi:hypothetical protein
MLFWIEDSNSSTRLRILEQTNVANLINVETTASLRDPSAWYHIVLTVDTTEATASDRVKIYINGVQQTALSLTEYPSLNADLVTNSTTPHAIGRRTRNNGANIYSDKYLAEVNFIDGQALDPTDFGEFKSGVWVAKSYSGSYGTNGFYLDFSNSGSLGADSSGNGNNWTANNLAATDVVLDSPTNNFPTWNPVAKNSSFAMTTLSEGNLMSVSPSTSNQYSEISFYLDKTNKYYFEYYSVANTGPYDPGNFAIQDPTNPTGNEIDIYITTTGYIYVNNSLIGSSFPALSAGDILQIAFDGSTGKVWAGKNGTWYNASGVATGDPAAGTNPIATLTPAIFKMQSVFYSNGCRMNFGQDSSFAGGKTAQGNTDDNGVGDFYYAPPSGYLALCTANLPDPAIDPAKDDVPSDYFNTVLYTGNGGTQSITGFGFQPDFVWDKSRSNADSHSLIDAVRGVGKYLRTNLSSAEVDDASVLTSFDSDGVTVGDINGNASGSSSVMWAWLAGGSAVTNTDGSITTSVSANPSSGFAALTFTGNGTSGATLGHGLGIAPAFVIVKKRSGGASWRVQHQSLGPTKRLYLDETGAAVTSSSQWNNTAPTSSVITIGNDTGVNENGQTFVCYAFAEVEGYSKFGSYTGNGSTDGPFVYTGFRPAWVLWKNASGTNSWSIHDTARDTFNVCSKGLQPNLSNAEASFNFVDILSNGFKLRASDTSGNASGNTYIYMAFAEYPFKYSLAR